jgi:hypothetical protein
LIHPAKVSSMNCHGFSSGATLVLLPRFRVDDPISGQDGVRMEYEKDALPRKSAKRTQGLVTDLI